MDAQVRARRGSLPLRFVLGLDQLEEALRLAAVVEQDAVDGSLPAAREVVGRGGDPPGRGVPGEGLRGSDAVEEDLAERLRVVVAGPGICRRDAVLAVRAVPAERVDAQDLAEGRGQVLRVVEWIARAAAVRH